MRTINALVFHKYRKIVVVYLMATRMQCFNVKYGQETHKPAYIKSCINFITVPASANHLRHQQFTEI